MNILSPIPYLIQHHIQTSLLTRGHVCNCMKCQIYYPVWSSSSSGAAKFLGLCHHYQQLLIYMWFEVQALHVTALNLYDTHKSEWSLLAALYYCYYDSTAKLFTSQPTRLLTALSNKQDTAPPDNRAHAWHHDSSHKSTSYCSFAMCKCQLEASGDTPTICTSPYHEAWPWKLWNVWDSILA